MEDHLLRIEKISKSYKRKKIVNQVSISIRKGEVVGLLGPNGAGKTTTFYMIVGLVTPDNGKIFFDNREITHMAMYKRARCGIGYLSQEPSIFRKLTVAENIMAVLETMHLRRAERKKRLGQLLEELHMAHL
ncbi:MAG: ATP-binding cassette domain-containing protein, partial [Candidatus Omnitrophica bacterium]|nr:ATP-binding cassette domain-containing protein [Candidatus Omnitrophota bacterium]